jgi:hypothetical protein
VVCIPMRCIMRAALASCVKIFLHPARLPHWLQQRSLKHSQVRSGMLDASLCGYRKQAVWLAGVACTWGPLLRWGREQGHSSDLPCHTVAG